MYANVQAIYNPAYYFGLSNIQSQQELMPKMLNSSMPQQTLKSEFVNNNQLSQILNIEKQLMQQSYQNQLQQNLPYYSILNFSINPNILSLNQLDMGLTQNQDYRRINPTLALLPKSLDYRLTPLPAFTPTPNGYMYNNSVYDQGFYSPKS